MKPRIIALLSLIPALSMVTPIYKINNEVLVGERIYNNTQQKQSSSFSESNFEEFFKKTKQKKQENELQKIREEIKTSLLEEEKRKEELFKTVPKEIVSKTLSRGGSIQEINLRVSFYTVSYQETGKIDGITASNKKIQKGHIAMPKEFSFGTKIYIEGLKDFADNTGLFTNEDTGGAIYSSNGIVRIDVYVPNATQKQLMNLGVIYTKGYIIN